jgi:hypothetical protein
MMRVSSKSLIRIASSCGALVSLVCPFPVFERDRQLTVATLTRKECRNARCRGKGLTFRFIVQC